MYIVVVFQFLSSVCRSAPLKATSASAEIRVWIGSYLALRLIEIRLCKIDLGLILAPVGRFESIEKIAGFYFLKLIHLEFYAPWKHQAVFAASSNEPGTRMVLVLCGALHIGE